MSECLSDNGPAQAVALGKPVLETQSKMWVDDIQAECQLMAFATPDPKIEIIAVVKGTVRDADGVPVRVHSECFTGDVLGSQRCDCGQQLHKFMRIMNDSACGVLLYIRGQEGRGIGLFSKIRAYHLQDQGHDTVDANLKLGLPVDIRSYEDALRVLQDLGLKSVRLYTNNPDKMTALKSITQEVAALASVPSAHSVAYLKTKRERLNHRTVLETFKLPELGLEKSQLRIGLVYTTWNQYFVDELVSFAGAELTSSGAETLKMAVPGACELISGCRITLRHHKPDAVIAVGVLIRGSSDLYDRTCNAVMSGLTELNAIQDTPIVLGILMCQNEIHPEAAAFFSSRPFGRKSRHGITAQCQMLGLKGQHIFILANGGPPLSPDLFVWAPLCLRGGANPSPTKLQSSLRLRQLYRSLQFVPASGLDLATTSEWSQQSQSEL
ncbi:ribBA [Symbiodinium microadriaticum]|nr:ribBA [Symbiodinium microadriaticum]